MDSHALKELAEDPAAMTALHHADCTWYPSDLHDLASIADSEPQSLYQEMNIPKGDGRTRTIHAPHPQLKNMQQQLKIVLNRFPLHDSIYGFRQQMGTALGLR